jgi:AraC family transcriptional activator of tynA and feaB
MDCDSRERDTFDGRVTRVGIGELGFHQVVAQAQDVFRTRTGIARGSRHPYYLIAQRERNWHVRQDGRLLQLRPGDLVLLDSSRPYELHFPERFSVMSIQLPRAFVGRWLLQAEGPAPRLVSRDRGWGAPLAAMCLQLAEAPLAAAHYPAELLSDHLGALLAAALEPAAATPACTPDLVDRATTYLRERLPQPGLFAQAAADALGISVRSLHRAFAARGLTFAATLRRLRLEAAQALLAQPRLARLSIAEIGRRSGFADASHFVREFRAATGTTPDRWRKGGASVP